jgi:hypothetical protein
VYSPVNIYWAHVVNQTFFFGAGVCSNEQDRLVPALIELINLIVAKTNMKFLLVIQTLKKKAICY